MCFLSRVIRRFDKVISQSETLSDRPSTHNVAEHVGCGVTMLITCLFVHGDYELAFEQ